MNNQTNETPESQGLRVSLRSMHVSLKDIIVMLSFLGSGVGLYVKLTEQVISLEQKVIGLEAKTAELQKSNAVLSDKVDVFRETVHKVIVRAR